MIGNNPEEPPGSVWEHIQDGLDRELYDWYRERVENPSESPPQQTWENIENQLDKSFFNWYGQGIAGNTEEPPEDVWNNIQDELDIEDTWTRISKRLDKAMPQKHTFIVYAAAAALLAFLVLRVFSPFEKDLQFPDKQKEYAAEQNNNAGQAMKDQTPAVAADTSVNFAERLAEEGDETISLPAEVNRKVEKQIDEGTAASEAVSQPDESPLRNEQLAMSKLASEQIEFRVSSDAGLVNMPALTAVEETEDQTPGKLNYYLGMTGEMGQSWLLSQKTLYSIRKSPYSSASPDQGKSLGIIGGLNLNDRLTLQMEGLLINESGQHYREYTNGELIHKQIYLDYASLNVLGRYKLLDKSFRLPVSHHAVLGLYGSYLKNAREQFNGTTENMRPAYKNHNFGMIFGYELDTHISPDFIISTGFRFDPGFINIYQGVPNLPASFNETYSSSVNVNLSVKFNISR